jgi:uncharacterized protein YbaP (TraB family)
MGNRKRIFEIIGLIVLVILFIVGMFFIYKTLIDLDKEEVNIEMKPILYKVTKDGSDNEMYLFGSIHMAKSDDLSFPDYIMNAYNKSHYLACEIDEEKSLSDADLTQQLALAMMYNDGSTIKDHINIDVYNKLVDFLTKKESYTSVFDYYKPMFFYSLLSNIMGNDSGLDPNSGIDNYFISKAKEDKKTILEVESMDYQIELLLGFSDDLYELMIKETLDNYEENVKELMELYNNWKMGNEEKILELNDEEFKEDDSYTEKQKKEIKEYNERLVINRNKTMTNKAIEYFEKDQDVFFMVGAGHIIGENGIANNLKNKGYIVTQVK